MYLWALQHLPGYLPGTAVPGRILIRPRTKQTLVQKQVHLVLCNLRLNVSTQDRRIGGMSHRAACGWSHVHVDSGPVALCGPVTLYLLQWPASTIVCSSWFQLLITRSEKKWRWTSLFVQCLDSFSECPLVLFWFVNWNSDSNGGRDSPLYILKRNIRSALLVFLLMY